MDINFVIANTTMELSDIADKWTFDEAHNAWCLEDVLYTPKAVSPAFQRLSIFVPKAYMSAPGVVDKTGSVGGYTAETVPVIFENNSAGYSEMPNTWLGGPRNYADQYLDAGFVYVTCGCRGHQTVDSEGNYHGRSPYALVDLKMAIRFLRHNRECLPGDYDKIISVGWSAGGAMSALVSVTGNNKNYDEYLEESGAFMDERDDVYGGQIYCPITDLEHADAAYEWMFISDNECEPNMTAPEGGKHSPFESALSTALKDKFVSYINSLDIKGCQLGEDGRSGEFYDYVMGKLNDSATKYLTKLAAGELPEKYTPQDYITGNYRYMAMAPHRPSRNPNDNNNGPTPQNSLGSAVLRTTDRPAPTGFKNPLVETQGTDKTSWLSWDGEKATITSIDDYVLSHRRRKKSCPSFDALGGASPENREMSDSKKTSTHFDPAVYEIIETLKESFPEEYEKYSAPYSETVGDPALDRRVYLINPLNYIGTDEETKLAEHFRIRVGAVDADTSFSVSALLALKLIDAGYDTDYELVWDQPHSEADYPGEVTAWVDSICK